MIGKWLRLPDGTVMHVLMQAPRRKRCPFCRPGEAAFCSRLCDFEIEPGKTCDAAMCAGCARPVGPDRDFCPNHSGERMGEHYPESAIGEHVFAHCSTCGRSTEHVIVRHSEHAGKIGHCVDPKHPKAKMTKKQEKDAAAEKRRRQNPELPFA